MVNNIISRIYGEIGEPKAELVELLIYSSHTLACTRLSLDRIKLGIIGLGDEGFLAFHEVWHGYPRVHIAVDKLKELNEKLRMAIIEHELVHTILHGSLDYYLIPIPHMVKLDPKVLSTITYLVSVAVKDYEVLSTLLKHGFINEQIEYLRYMLESEVETVNVEPLNLEVKALIVSALLKHTITASPFIELNISRHYTWELLEKFICNIKTPRDVKFALLNISLNVIPKVKGDFQDKVLRVVGSIVEHLNLEYNK